MAKKIKPPWITKDNERLTTELMKTLYLPQDDVPLQHNPFFPEFVKRQKKLTKLYLKTNTPDKIVKYDIYKFDNGQPCLQDLYKLDYVRNDSVDLLLQANYNPIKALVTQKHNIMYEKVKTPKKKKQDVPIEEVEIKQQIPKILNDNHKTKISSLNTKINNKICRIDEVIRCRKYEIQFHKDQSRVLISWIKECLYLYNFCVDRNKVHPLSTKWEETKLIVFAEFYGTTKYKGCRRVYIQKYNEYYDKYDPTKQFTISDWFRPMSKEAVRDMSEMKRYKVEKNNKKFMPYDVLTDVVQSFCINLTSNLTKINKGLQTHFTMHHKRFHNFSSLLVTKKVISKEGIFLNALAKYTKFTKPLLEKITEYSKAHFNINLNVDEIDCNCRLKYDKRNDKYYLCVPTFISTKEVVQREEFCALDPGEKIFQTFYGEKSCGTIGNLFRHKIIEIQGSIKKLTKVLQKDVNKRGEKLKNRFVLWKRIRKKYLKIENIVKELHNKTALFLCKNFERILIPKFETKKMLSDHYSLLKNRAKNLKPSSVYRPKKTKITKRKEERLKQFGRPSKPPDPPDPLKYNKKRLPGNVKFVLQMMSHYKFKQHLFNKGEEYGCKIIEVTEEYTSKTCGNCGLLSDNYHNRIKKCSHCKTEIDRDLNGARNILIKNIKLILEDLSCLSCNISILNNSKGCLDMYG